MIVVTVARRPLAQATVVQNVLALGTGAVAVDKSRVSASDPFGGGKHGASGFTVGYEDQKGWVAGSALGRWPANLVLQHHKGCSQIGLKSVKGSKLDNTCIVVGKPDGYGGGWAPFHCTGYTDKDGKETVIAWDCEPGCPVAALDAQSGDCPVSGAARNHKPVTGDFDGGMFGSIGSRGTGAMHDAGGASRFFKQCKEGS